jgi:hypothetical protein
MYRCMSDRCKYIQPEKIYVYDRCEYILAELMYIYCTYMTGVTVGLYMEAVLRLAEYKWPIVQVQLPDYGGGGQAAEMVHCAGQMPACLPALIRSLPTHRYHPHLL